MTYYRIQKLAARFEVKLGEAFKAEPTEELKALHERAMSQVAELKTYMERNEKRLKRYVPFIDYTKEKIAKVERYIRQFGHFLRTAPNRPRGNSSEMSMLDLAASEMSYLGHNLSGSISHAKSEWVRAYSREKGDHEKRRNIDPKEIQELENFSTQVFRLTAILQEARSLVIGQYYAEEDSMPEQEVLTDPNELDKMESPADPALDEVEKKWRPQIYEGE